MYVKLSPLLPGHHIVWESITHVFRSKGTFTGDVLKIHYTDESGNAKTVTVGLSNLDPKGGARFASHLKEICQDRFVDGQG